MSHILTKQERDECFIPARNKMKLHKLSINKSLCGYQMEEFDDGINLILNIADEDACEKVSCKKCIKLIK